MWRFNADYTKVSDPDYFNDFSSKYGSSTDGYATQKLSAGYANQNFDATVSTKQFRVFNRDSSNAYSAEPQLDVNYYQNDVGPFDTHLYGQAVHFVNSNSRMPEATRVHFEPTINLPLSNGWEASIPRQNCWQPITSKATLMTTTRPTVPIIKTPLTA